MEITPAVRQAVMEEECLRTGHDFGVVVTVKGEPNSVLCHRCGEFWRVQPK